MPSIFDMLLGASPNVQQVDQSDPTGAYLGNMIDPNTAAQFQSAMNQQKMLGLSMGLLSGSAPQLGKPVSFGGALAQGLAGMQQSQNSLVPQALQAAQTSNQIAEGGFNKLKALQLGYQISNMPAAFQSMDNLNKMMKGGAAPGGAPGASPEGGASGAGQQSDSGLTVGAPQKLTSGNLDLNDPAGLVKRFESGGDYNVGFGKVDLSGAKLDQYGFPIWDGKEGPAGISHAAGAYQFEPKTWRQYASKLGIHDFSPESQDKVFAAAFADQGFGAWAPYNSNIASALRNGAGRGPLFGGNTTQQQPQADNQQPPQQGGSAPQGESAPQAAIPPGQFATGAAPFTKTNSVGEQYQWNGEGWQLVGKQAPANVAGGTSGAGDTVNGIDKTSGPVTAPMMGPLASAQPPVQVASNGPLRPGILAGSSQIARPPVGIPPGVLGGGAPPQAPQMPVAPPQPRPPVQMAQVNQAGQANPYPNAGTVPSNITPPGGAYNGISPQQIQTARDVITRYNAAGMGQMVPDYIKNLATMDINAAAEAAKAWAGVGPDIYKQNNIPQNIREGEGIRVGPNIVNAMPTLKPGVNAQGQPTIQPINPLTGQPANIPGVGFLPQLGGAGSPAGAGNAPAGGRPTLGGPAPQTGAGTAPGPVVTGLSPQQQQEQSKRGTALGELPQKVNDAAESARNQQANLLVMRNDAQNIYTGKGAETLNTFAQFMRLVDPSYNQPVASAESFVKNGGALLRGAVHDTSGRAAVQEYNLISKTLPNLETSPQGLQQLLGEFMGFNDYKIAKAQALQDWINDPTHNNTAQGFEADFQKNVSPYAYLVLRMSPEQQNDMVTKLSASDAGKKALSRIMGETQYIKAHNLEASY